MVDVSDVIPEEISALMVTSAKVEKCWLALVKLYAESSEDALKDVYDSYFELAESGFMSFGGDDFSAPMPINFHGIIGASYSGIVGLICEHVISTGVIPEGVISKESNELGHYIQTEYEIAYTRLARETKYRQVSNSSQQPVSQPKIKISQLWKLIEGRVNGIGETIANSPRTLYGWQKREDWPQDMAWESVRAWVLKHHHIDIGECEKV